MSEFTHALPVPSRRAVMVAAGTVGLAAALVACGDGGKDKDASEPAGAATSGAPGEELAKTSEIPVGGGKVFKDQGVVVTQPAEGEFKAFSNRCTHKGCPVTRVEDGTINCPCHGSKFDIADGGVRHAPASRPLPAVKIDVADGAIRLA